MGVYRLLLAYLVVLSHMSPNLYGFNLGVVAVVSFFLLSGFVMSALIRKYYLSPGLVVSFYMDRFARIAPQFYLYALLTVIAVAAFELRHPWLTSAPSAGRALVQFFIVTLNIYPYADMLVPQAWSLGLEVTFYLTFPFVLLFRLRLPIAAVSFVIFLFAYAAVLNFDRWGYRLLPGTMFIFICGSWIESSENGTTKNIPALVAISAAILLVLSYTVPTIALTDDYLKMIRRSTLLGIVVGVPIVHVLKYADNGSKLARAAGDLSYGVFLNHVLIIGVINRAIPIKLDSCLIIPICLLSTVSSYASYRFVEAPVLSLRRRLRVTT
ncbi:acyltransferase [Methylosinus sp. Sm6]|uniref:acyltransferase family protein n=1 Tax=Methylosinus sp. Sm6 TaxID=2866948 RepID=UPI001C98EBB5|nr:acyltransferase [Methylosinus sp. Sm6]MBY6244000.1 acyltransferase [Methylosinus sp. Sm6]